MPGGRLTDEDRRDIASGLTHGLGYAEIARRLGRPTSTITREVSRNGGARDYRADRAHLATRRRARRRKTATPGPPPDVVGAEGRDPAAVLAFAEEFAELMVRMGLPRMAARVLASLVTTDAGALTTAELVGRLRVSPASVSKAVGYLEGLDLLRRERDARRRERYFIDDDVWLRTWLTSAQTNAVLADTVRRGVDVFDPATPAGARLDRMRRFFGQLSDDMSGGPGMVDGDLVTVLAALVRAVTPEAADRLAADLGWSPDRVAEALRDAGTLCDAVPVIRATDSGGRVDHAATMPAWP
ncbi:MarR family protein [Saccharothrix carnea]|uniref:MarR family protein n=2 Tax=Saccharothrix carnea TaxID=1280637 RepID=A0A2P8HZQ8_SACCR|nr:MarR family protein [Saccharothrix carnea]